MERKDGGKASTPSTYEFATNVSCHGVRNVADAGRTATRIVWLLAVLAAIGFLCYQVSTACIAYFRYTTVTEVVIKSENFKLFPHITICNHNKFKHQYIMDVIKRLEEFEGISHYDNSSLFRYLNDGFKALEHTGKLAESTHSDLTEYPKITNSLKNIGINNFKELVDNISYSIYDEVLRLHHNIQIDIGRPLCAWYGTDEKKCSENDFSIFYTRYGRCFEFNAGNDTLRQLRAGASQGLHLTYYSNQDENFEHILHHGDPNEGILVLAHAADEFPDIDEAGLAVPTGSYARLSMKHTKIERIPPPWGECKEETLKHFKKYSHKNCKVECLIEMFESQCNCTPIQFDVSGITTHCDPLHVIHCIQPSYRKYLHGIGWKCPLSCAPACIEYEYTGQVTTSLFPNAVSARYLADVMSQVENKTVSTKSVETDIIVLDIHFKRLESIQYIQRRSKTAVELIADIGGQMGLCIGASLLTIMEFIEFFFAKLTRKKDNKIETKPNPGACETGKK